jgi:hypothetical protein
MPNQQKIQNAIPKPAIGVGLAKTPVTLNTKPATPTIKTTFRSKLAGSLSKLLRSGESKSTRAIRLVPITASAIKKNPIIDAL